MFLNISVAYSIYKLREMEVEHSNGCERIYSVDVLTTVNMYTLYVHVDTHGKEVSKKENFSCRPVVGAVL